MYNWGEAVHRSHLGVQGVCSWNGVQGVRSLKEQVVQEEKAEELKDQ